MSSHIVDSYLAHMGAVRRYREYELMEAIRKLDQPKIVQLFISEPSLTKFKPKGGGTLLHELFKVPTISEQDESNMYTIMSTLYAWGVEFSVKDNKGNVARTYIQTRDILEGYRELGGPES